MQPFNARLFIALPVPPIYRPVLTSWTDMLKEKWSFSRWIHPNDYHITLKFLGECNFNQALLIKERLKNVTRTITPFSLTIEALGTFDNRSSSKILWAGIRGELHQLHQLQQQIEIEMEQLGFEKENKFYHPHVTLARSYLDGIIANDELLLAPTIKEEILAWEAKELVLYNTHLGKSPAYQPLSIYSFQG